MTPRSVIKLAAVRLWAYTFAAVARGAWRTLDAIERRAGEEGLLRALEESSAAGAVSLLRARGARVGERVRVMRGLTLHNTGGNFSGLDIGSGCHIGRQVFIDLAAPVTIGQRVTISMRCTILTHAAVGDSQSAVASAVEERRSVLIEDDAYVGAGVTILAGVRVGRGAVIGAGAVVNESIPANSVVGGVPARRLRHTTT